MLTGRAGGRETPGLRPAAHSRVTPRSAGLCTCDPRAWEVGGSGVLVVPGHPLQLGTLKVSLYLNKEITALKDPKANRLSRHF